MANNQRSRERRLPRGKTRPPRKRILVVCEGEVTEPRYINDFKAWRRNPMVEVTISAEHGVPRTCVQIAIRLKEQADDEAKRQRDDTLRYDEVWCAFDIDDHPNVPEARQQADPHRIRLAVSNPSFELWLLLHFRESPGAQHRKDLAKMLKKFLPDYEKTPDFELLQPGYDEAVRRAERLDRDAEQMDEAGRNPTTGVHALTRSIAEG